MTLWGVGKMGKNGGGHDGAAAWVNGEVITQREFAQEYEARLAQYQKMLGGQYDEKFLEALQIPNRTLDEMVQVRLLSQQAKRLGVYISDQELSDFIRNQPYFQKNGTFNAELYAKIPSRGIEERRQRDRLMVSRFYSYLTDRVRLTPTAARQAYLLSETKVDLETGKIDFESLAKNQPAPASAAVQAYLKATSPEDLKKEYDARSNEFSNPAQVQLKQIRVGVPFQATDKIKAEAKLKIEAIQKTLNVGANPRVMNHSNVEAHALIHTKPASCFLMRPLTVSKTRCAEIFSMQSWWPKGHSFASQGEQATSWRIKWSFLDQGCQASGVLVPLKITTISISCAAAMWAGPESLPTYKWQASKRTGSSLRRVIPLKSQINGLVVSTGSNIFSSSVPIKTICAISSLRILSMTSLNFSGGQRFAG